MKERRVVLAPEAADDLNALYDWIAGRASPQVSMAYLERVEDFKGHLGLGPSEVLCAQMLDLDFESLASSDA